MVWIKKLAKNVVYSVCFPPGRMDAKAPAGRYEHGKLPMYSKGLVISSVAKPVVQDVVNARDFIHEYPVDSHLDKEAILAVTDILAFMDKNVVDRYTENVRPIIGW